MLVLIKLLGSLLYPLNLALLAAIGALLLRRRAQLSRVLLAFAVAWLWAWSTPWVAEQAARSLEHAYPPLPAERLPPADAIVLLGGLLDPASSPHHDDLNAAADRVRFAAQLWRAGKAPRLVCSGGLAPLSRASAAECPRLAVLLAELGVPPEAVVTEADSRTTRENADRTAALLPPGARVLLVSSARHLPRAVAAFEAAGLRVIPAATDHAWRTGRPFAATALLPSPAALTLSTGVWHEWLGRAWYALRG
jgi:uncharacterized SAM-binding protein YcdF (DUF218 family)